MKKKILVMMMAVILFVSGGCGPFIVITSAVSGGGYPGPFIIITSAVVAPILFSPKVERPKEGSGGAWFVDPNNPSKKLSGEVGE